MALVEKFHVVAAERPVYTGEDIKEGQVVSLRNVGGISYVVKQSASYVTPYGIAGDTKNTTASSMPGIATGWQGRVSDYFDETKASAKMTVYHSGGEFATDMFSNNVGAQTVMMTPLYANDGYLCTAAESTTSGIVARLTQPAGQYPSGVPGVDINGDMALSGAGAGGTYSNQYIEFKLVI